MTSERISPQPLGDDDQGRCDCCFRTDKDTRVGNIGGAYPLGSVRTELLREWAKTTCLLPSLIVAPPWRRVYCAILSGNLEELTDDVDLDHGEVTLGGFPPEVPDGFLVMLEEAILDECMEF
jgi:hypothetical protein